MARNRKPKRRKPVRASKPKPRTRARVSVPLSGGKSAKMPVDKAIVRGVELHQQGNLAAAESIYRAILCEEPHSFDALHHLGAVCLQTGRLDEALALLEKAIDRNARSAEVRFNHGLALQMLKRNEEAASSYSEAVRLKPDYAEAYNNLGLVLHELRRGDESIASYDAALSLKPDYVAALVNRGNVLKAINRLEEAIASYDRAIALKPDNASAHNNRGGALRLMKRYDEALSSFDEALRLASNHASAHNNRGAVFQEIGDREQAISAYRSALSINPDFPDAHRNLTLLQNYSQDDPDHANRIEGSLGKPGHSESDKMQLHFALGKIYADCQRADDAFEHYAIANRIGARRAPYDARAHTALIDRLITTFSNGMFTNGDSRGDDSVKPVLIVGMPRSGTTLVEQIVSSHPKVAAGGELETIRELESAIDTSTTAETAYPESVTSLASGAISRFARQYLTALEGISGDAERITDKMPRNFLSLGLFRLMFPKGHIIHCRRNPLDTSLSIYFNFFPEGHPYSFDLASIAHYYAEYERIVEHWRATEGIDMFEVQYEDLVHDQEKTSRALIDHIGLEWDPRCIEFHKNKRPVSTASSEQVRRPMYATSVDRWKAYEAHLGPLLEAFGDSLHPADIGRVRSHGG